MHVYILSSNCPSIFSNFTHQRSCNLCNLVHNCGVFIISITTIPIVTKLELSTKQTLLLTNSLLLTRGVCFVKMLKKKIYINTPKSLLCDDRHRALLVPLSKQSEFQI